jgi:NTP pyrophosphatase (non-canonical NTP hydrolase)
MWNFTLSYIKRAEDETGPYKIDRNFCTFMEDVSPLQMIQRLKSDTSYDFENPLSSLESRKITVVTEKPEKIKLVDIKQTLDNTNWADTRIIDWWLTYWCDLHDTITFFTGGDQAAQYRNLPNSDWIKNKIVCVSIMWYKARVHSRTDELERFDIFQCTKLLIPVNLDESHWVLACIQIDGNRITIEWYDSLHDGSKDKKNDRLEQTTELAKWLNSRNEARNQNGAATTAATPPLEITTVAANRAKEQSNVVDCCFWVCMYAAYLCIGIPCDIKEEQSNSTKNIKHVRSWMIAIVWT